MNGSDCVVRTHAGVEEIRTRSHELPPRLRTMLIMIDGTLTVDRLHQAAATLGVAADGLETLRAAGLVELQPSGRAHATADDRPASREADEAGLFRAAQRFMNDTMVDALGIRAFLFTLKLDRCHTRADLGNLVEAYERTLLKASGAEVAGLLGARARALLRLPRR